jgi:hypothetical protein
LEDQSKNEEHPKQNLRQLAGCGHIRKRYHKTESDVRVWLRLFVVIDSARIKSSQLIKLPIAKFIETDHNFWDTLHFLYWHILVRNCLQRFIKEINSLNDRHWKCQEVSSWCQDSCKSILTQWVHACLCCCRADAYEM